MSATPAVRPLAEVLTEHVDRVVAERAAFETSLEAMDATDLVALDRLAAAADPLCTFIDDALGEECGADRTLFAVTIARRNEMGHVVPVRARCVTSHACPEHLVAAIAVAEDDPALCSVVVPIAEHPLRGRPTKARA